MPLKAYTMKILLLPLLFFWSTLTHSQSLDLSLNPQPDIRVGLHVGSYHSKPGYNNVNPGVYFRYDNLAVGTYRNSLIPGVHRPGFNTHSAYVVYLWQLHQNVELATGIITGYRTSPAPLVMPNFVFNIHKNMYARVFYLPKIGKVNDSHIVSFAVEWKL